MKGKKITVKVKTDKVKAMKRASREIFGLPKPGKTITPKKGVYKRRPKYRQPLDEE